MMTARFPASPQRRNYTMAQFGEQKNERVIEANLFFSRLLLGYSQLNYNDIAIHYTPHS